MAVLTLALALGACIEPEATDEPALSSTEDSDGDGLADADEGELGTDPFDPDTDGDGYLDSWELAEGSDPLDAESVIYQGGWPYNPDKEGIEDPGTEVAAAVGSTVARFAMSDQFGDMVDTYDFLGQDRYVVLELGSAWCYYTAELALWLLGEPSYFDSYEERYGWEAIPPAVADGRVLWINVLDSYSSAHEPPTQRQVEAWYKDFPNPAILVLLDPYQTFLQHTQSSYWPSLVLVDAEGTILQKDPENSYFETITRLGELLTE